MPTIKDIASDAGVSFSAVSLALNGRASVIGISEATAKRIHESAEKLGYKPHLMARALRSGKTRTIGVLMPVVYGIYWQHAAALQEEARRLGYFTIFSFWQDKDGEDEAVKALLARQVDALISFSPSALLEKSKVPVVYYSNPDEKRDYVRIDYDSSLKQSAELIIRKGYKKVLNCRCFSTGNQKTIDIGKYADKKFTVEKLEIGKGNLYLAASKAAEEYFSSPNTEIPDLVTGTDEIVIGIANVLRSKGIKVPENLALLGFDNLPESERFWVPLSSFDTGSKKFAAALCELLMRRLENPAAENTHILIEPQLIERQSTPYKKQPSQ
ncbi:MAG: hypothetical protein A2X49_06205 [Lentisphaerae bacterium GWF2_52_8]|nr:MAG: hypothetical protein A2X49_06205 [Lentisphaerae bacterium GWF2_52_8]